MEGFPVLDLPAKRVAEHAEPPQIVSLYFSFFHQRKDMLFIQ
jgi:hypothetical protein